MTWKKIETQGDMIEQRLDSHENVSDISTVQILSE